MPQMRVSCPICGKIVSVIMQQGMLAYNAHWANSPPANAPVSELKDCPNSLAPIDPGPLAAVAEIPHPATPPR